MKIKEFNQILPAVLDKGISQQWAKQEFYFAGQLVSRNKLLQKCTKKSILNATFEAITLGLSLNPALSFGYLIPRWNRYKQIHECEFQPGYQGLAHLALSEGVIEHIVVQLVHENDHFSIDLASGSVSHKPDLKKRGDILAAYGIATDKNGHKTVEYMDISELNKIMETSDAYQSFKAGKSKSTPWNQWRGEMCRKSVIKRMFKYLNKQPSSQLAEAIEIDNKQFPASANQIGLIESLLPTAALTEGMENQIDSAIQDPDLSSTEASRIITYLKENQPLDMHRSNGSATNINVATQQRMELEDFKERTKE